MHRAGWRSTPETENEPERERRREREALTETPTKHGLFLANENLLCLPLHPDARAVGFQITAVNFAQLPHAWLSLISGVFRSPFFIAALWGSFQFVILFYFLSFFLFWMLLLICSLRLCLFFQPFLIFYLLLFALSLSLKKPNYSDVEWKWNYTDHSNLGCNYPLNAHTPLIFKITAYSTSFAQSSMSFYQSLAHSGWIVRFLEFIHCLRWRMKARHFSQCHQFEIPIICV